ncbi:MAG: hypothetical protein WEA29_04360 [Acidimicrobiia bacterium]
MADTAATVAVGSVPPVVATVMAMPGDTAYDFGYLVGGILAALLVAYAVMWVIGVVRNDRGNRTASGRAFAHHYRTLWLAALLYAAALLGRFVLPA